MKRILFFCNTYYQLIVAMQMRLTLKKMDNVSVILTNESKNAATVYKRLKDTGVFTGVYFMPTKVPPAEMMFLQKFYYLKRGFLGYVPVEMEREVFDEIIGFNFDLATHEVYSFFKHKNPNMIVSRMEEGLLSYNTPDTDCGVMRLFYCLRRLCGKTNLKNEVSCFYCFIPLAYTGDLQTVELPRIKLEDQTIRQLLNVVFLGGHPVKTYKEKYIFLSCIYDIEGGEPIGELKLVLQISELVGKENLIVKVHPRDDPARFTQCGLNVDENSSVPWEVIQMNGDFSNNVFLTTLSGSVFIMNTILENSPKIFYLYPLCKMEKNRIAIHYSEVLNYYLNNSYRLGIKNIRLSERLEDILD